MSLKCQKPRDEAIEIIENYIIKNRLKPNDRLPSERKMCEMFDFNRSTLRNAIKQLILEGKIYNKNGSGTYVAREKVVRNLQDSRGLFQAAASCGRTLTSEVLKLERCEANKSLVKKMKVLLGHKLWYIERLRKLDGIPVTISRIYLDAERFSGFDQYDFTSGSLYDILHKYYGVEAKSGYEKLSITNCDEREAELLNVEIDTPVVYQSGVTMDEDERAFESFRELTLTEYVSFASELTRR